jgi:hypothetical protein
MGLPTGLPQEQKRPGHQKLDIVGVRSDGQGDAPNRPSLAW